MIEKHYHNVQPPAHIKLLLISEAPPPMDKPENYIYNVTDGFSADGRKRSFFRELMKGIGLISENAAYYNERKVLDAFLEAGYFLIDSCPVAIIGSKKTAMLNYVDSIRHNIKSLNPDNILFITKSNDIIIKKLTDDQEVLARLVRVTALPYPGNGNQKKFRAEFPEEFKLKPIC